MSDKDGFIFSDEVEKEPSINPVPKQNIPKNLDDVNSDDEIDMDDI